MNEIINTYIVQITSKFQRLQTSELGYRSEFESLLKSIFNYLDQLIDRDDF